MKAKIIALIPLAILGLLCCSGIELDTADSDSQESGSTSGSGSSSEDTGTSSETGTISTLSWTSASGYYYVTGIQYCSNPADASYEKMGIFIPAAYLTKNSDGSFSINPSGTCNGYTASTAPVVIPVNTPGYSAQSAPTGKSSKVESYTDEGLIYLWPGCRGKDASAPSGVTDIKAAIRYYRRLVKEGSTPGDTTCMFVFGHSGGGAQCAILGSSGNSPLYDKYLEELGAETAHADDLLGAMCWCPVTNLDQANGAYEWNMGRTRSGLYAADQDISKALSGVFADYINAIGLRHPKSGEVLKLEATDDGYFQAGSYYSYMMEVINDAVSRYNKNNGGNVSSYSTSDPDALYTFANSNKKASKGLGAFDAYDGESRTSAANLLFDPEGVWSHYDKYLAEIVATYAPQYKSAFDADLAQVDRLGNDLQTRLAMYTPMYYLVNNSRYYAWGGTGSSDVAPYWRIRSGIKQGDTSLCTETNLALALSDYDGVRDVDFGTIWNQGHTQAEDNGDATDNFITWVHECVKDFRSR